MKAAATPLKFERDSEAVVPRKVSPIKLKIRKFLRTSVGPSIAPTIVRLNEWLASIQARTLEKPIARRSSGENPLGGIGEELIGNGIGTGGRVLTKSLGEAFYFSGGFGANVTETEFRTRLSRYLICRCSPAF